MTDQLRKKPELGSGEPVLKWYSDRAHDEPRASLDALILARAASQSKSRKSASWLRFAPIAATLVLTLGGIGLGLRLARTPTVSIEQKTVENAAQTKAARSLVSPTERPDASTDSSALRESAATIQGAVTNVGSTSTTTAVRAPTADLQQQNDESPTTAYDLAANRQPETESHRAKSFDDFDRSSTAAPSTPTEAIEAMSAPKSEVATPPAPEPLAMAAPPMAAPVPVQAPAAEMANAQSLDKSVQAGIADEKSVMTDATSAGLATKQKSTCPASKQMLLSQEEWLRSLRMLTKMRHFAEAAISAQAFSCAYPDTPLPADIKRAVEQHNAE
jgi:hypothetical protein